MKPFISTPQTKQATQPATELPIQSCSLSNHYHPSNKAGIYANSGSCVYRDVSVNATNHLLTTLLEIKQINMKYIFIFLFTFLSNFTFGQQNNIDYNFVNSALRQVDKYDSTYFLLQRETYNCYLNEDNFERYLNELKGHIKAETLKELIKNSHSETIERIEFDINKLNKDLGFKLVKASRLDSLQRNKDYSIPLNRRKFYICSLPVFSNDKNYAIIEFGGGTARLAMTGRKYLFKKNKNEWRIIATFDNWAK